MSDNTVVRLYEAVAMKEVETVRTLIHDIDLNSLQPLNKSFVKSLLSKALRHEDTDAIKLLIKLPSIDNFSPLHCAILIGSGEIAKILVEGGIDIDIQTENGWTPLYLAILHNLEEIVELLLARNANVNAKAHDGTTALHVAIQSLNLTIVKMLLQRGATVDVVDRNGDDILYFTLECSSFEIIEEILQYHPNLNSRVVKQSVTKMIFARNSRGTLESQHMVNLLVEHGFTADSNIASQPEFVRGVVVTGNIKLVQDTLRHVRDVNAPQWRDPQLDYTLLQLALEHQRLDVAEALLRRGADVDARDNTGKSLAEWMAESNDTDGFKLLLDRGLDVRKYPSLLVAAVDAGSCGIVEILSVHPNIDVNVADAHGSTALHYTRERKIAQTLLRNGANANARADMGETPLHEAVASRNRAVVEVLLEHRATDVNIQDYDDRTPLVCCAFVEIENRGPTMEDVEGPTIAKMLLDRGADGNVRFNDDRRTVLHEASFMGHETIVRTLLEHVAKPDCPLVEYDDANQLTINAAVFGSFVDVNARDRNGITALHVALMVGFPHIAMMLLDHGADFDVKCDQGLSALDYATGEYPSESTGYGSGIWYCDSREIVEKKFYEAMLKIKASGRHLSERIVRALESSRWRDELSEFYASCEAEIAIMKTQKIKRNDRSLYDLLTMDANHLAVYMKNERGTLESLSSFRQMCPIYYDKIGGNLIAARKRNILLSPSVQSFNELFVDNDLPDCMVLEILSYLSNNDLGNMIKAVN